MTNKPLELHDYITQTKAAKMLGVSRMAIWRWIQEGKIRVVIVGEQRMIPQSEVARLQEGKSDDG